MFLVRTNFVGTILSRLLLVAITYSKVSCFDKNTQQFILFTEQYPQSQTCNGTTCQSKGFDDNIKDLSPLWEPVAQNRVKSWCSATQGMWLFYSEPNFGRNSSYYGFVKTSRSSGRIGSSVMQCVNLPPNQEIRSIRHFTHANLSRPSISLFTRVNGILQNELFMDGDAISLSTVESFGAYAFSGFNPWTVYSQVGFQGQSTCLNLPLDYDPNEASEVALLSVGINQRLQVGSAKLECNGTENVQLYPLNTTTAVLNLGESLTLFMERGSRIPPNAENNTTTTDEFEQEINVTRPAFIVTIPTMTNASDSNLQIYFSGAELVLPHKFNVSSFLPINSARNGSDFGEWELCSDLDFTGTCVCQWANTTRTINFSPHIIVMSAKFGCTSSNATSTAEKTLPISYAFLFVVFLQLSH